MKLFTRVLTAAGVVAFAAPTTAKADVPNISQFASTGVFTAATTGTVTVTFLFGRALFDSQVLLFLSGVGGPGIPSGPPMMVDGRYPNPSVSSVASSTFNVVAGQSLIFGICTSSIAGGLSAHVSCPNGDMWFMGPAGNPDGQPHAAIMTPGQWNQFHASGPHGLPAPPGTMVVGFEDVGPATTAGFRPDYDYNDVVFAFDNVTSVPEPGTMGLLALGLVGLSGAGLVRRRSSRKGK